MIVMKGFMGLITATVMLAVACGGQERPESVTGGADDADVFDFLASLDYGAVAATFASLEDQPPRLIRRTSEERDADGRVIGRLVASYRPTGVGAKLESVVDVRDGTFSQGFLSFLARGDSTRSQSGATVSGYLPSLPPFAAARTREQFRYDMRRDTTIGSEWAQSAVVEAVESPDKQPLRKATIAAARLDSAVLYIRIERLFTSLFYDEASTIEITVRRRDNGSGLEPARLFVSSTVDVPFRAPRTFVALEEYGAR